MQGKGKPVRLKGSEEPDRLAVESIRKIAAETADAILTWQDAATNRERAIIHIQSVIKKAYEQGKRDGVREHYVGK